MTVLQDKTTMSHDELMAEIIRLREANDKLKASQPVIVNLQSSDADLRRRLIDFASGLTYGVGGAMERVAKEVFLLTPSNVEISAEEKRRLQERGLMRS